MFHDREDAGHRLAETLKGRALRDPLVLAIPRGGVVTGAVIARELGAELDVILCRKLRAPWQPELALGAVSEDGSIYLDRSAGEVLGVTHDYLVGEWRYQLAEIERRRKLFRAARPKAMVAGRSVIVTDDGLATGSTMMAALKVIRAQAPHEVVVAVPVAPEHRLAEVREICDEVICLLVPDDFWAIGQFYEEFPQVEDEQVLELLQDARAGQGLAR